MHPQDIPQSKWHQLSMGLVRQRIEFWLEKQCAHMWNIFWNPLLQTYVRRLLRSHLQGMQQAIEYFLGQKQHPYELRK